METAYAQEVQIRGGRSQKQATPHHILDPPLINTNEIMGWEEGDYYA